ECVKRCLFFDHLLCSPCRPRSSCNSVFMRSIMTKTPLSRRGFLAASAVSALALPASAQPAGANERINVGLIGTGGRCRHLMQALAKVPNVRMTVLCDVYEPHIDLARKL